MKSPTEVAAVLRRAAKRVVPDLEETVAETMTLALVKAREKIGTMQPGWPEFADATVTDPRWVGPLERTGAMRESLYIEQRVLEGQLVSDSPYIIYSELGTSHEEPRPLLLESLREAFREGGLRRMRFAMGRIFNGV